jgi:hypothetical protein
LLLSGHTKHPQQFEDLDASFPRQNIDLDRLRTCNSDSDEEFVPSEMFNVATQCFPGGECGEALLTRRAEGTF